MRFAPEPSSEWRTCSVPAKNGALLGVVVDELATYSCTLADVTGVAVCMGQGRFTVTRVAVVVANMIAFARTVPVVRVDADASVATVYAALSSVPAASYITPLYNAPARIGKPAASAARG